MVFSHLKPQNMRVAVNRQKRKITIFSKSTLTILIKVGKNIASKNPLSVLRMEYIRNEPTNVRYYIPRGDKNNIQNFSLNVVFPIFFKDVKEAKKAIYPNKLRVGRVQSNPRLHDYMFDFACR